MRESQGSFKPYLNPVGAWALAFGCSIGWGAFLIPSTFLPSSGFLGSVLGIVLGVLIMLVIARNYRAMIVQYPKAGGTFTYATRVLGFDHGLLCAWFLCLTYLALIWANVSAFVLLARYTIGDFFQQHYLYSIAGFEIYFEEIVLCMGAIVLAGAICCFRKKLAQGAQVLFALVLAVGLFALFFGVLQTHPQSAAIDPLFLPGKNPLLQVVATVAIVPWAFVGFETISHSAEEFSFAPRKSFGIMAAAIAMAAVAYVFMLVISVLGVSGNYPSWVEYVSDLDNLAGLSAVPTFSAIRLALGDGGIALLGVTMLGALLSSLVGCTICVSRLITVMAENEIFPVWLAKRTNDGIPRNAIICVVVISAFIPFLGRTAIGWNVDVANIGATIAYGYTSFCAYRCSRATNDKLARAFGIAGTVLAVLFLLLMLLPSNALAKESYLIFTGWVILGFFLNYNVFKRDRERRYGRSTIVWIALFVLSIYTAVSFVWQSSLDNAAITTEAIEAHYSVAAEPGDAESTDDFVANQMQSYRNAEMVSYLITLAIIIVSFRILLGNYSIMQRRETENARELGETRDKAYRDSLTGVKSVNAYRDREREIDEQIAAGKMPTFGLAVCDINNLKAINDRYGHQAGDECIKAGSMMICKVFTHSPVYRLGGDEFVVVLEGSDFEQRADLLSQLEAINDSHMQSGEILIAVGIAEWRVGDECVANVFARADIFMYQRKSQLKSLTEA